MVDVVAKRIGLHLHTPAAAVSNIDGLKDRSVPGRSSPLATAKWRGRRSRAGVEIRRFQNIGHGIRGPTACVDAVLAPVTSGSQTVLPTDSFQAISADMVALRLSMRLYVSSVLYVWGEELQKVCLEAKDSFQGVFAVIVNGADAAPLAVAVIVMSPICLLKWVPVLVILI